MVKSGFVDCDYYVNETVAWLKSGWYFQKRCKPGYLVTSKVPKTHTHTHTHRGMERHGEGHTQSDAHKDKERGREEEGGRG